MIRSFLLLFIAGAVFASDLQKSVEEIASHHQGGLTLYAEDLKTGRTVAIQPDKPVATASVIKLGVLYEALTQVRGGKIGLDDKLTLNKGDQVPGSGVLLFFDTPLAITFKDALWMMIIMSDNTATNLVIDHVGIANVNERMKSLGLQNTRLFKKVFQPAAPGTIPPELMEQQKKFGLGVTTAREMALLMHHFYTCDIGDLKLCDLAFKMFGDQFYRDVIPRYIDEFRAPNSGDGPAVGNKSGSLDDVRDDVAFIAGANGPIIISAFTYDNKDESWQAENEAELTIAKIAREIVHAWSPQGLSANGFKPAVQAAK